MQKQAKSSYVSCYFLRRRSTSPMRDSSASFEGAIAKGKRKDSSLDRGYVRWNTFQVGPAG